MKGGLHLACALASAVAGAATLGFASLSFADPMNLPPPSGAILDLAGTPITNVQQLYSVNFTASLANTAITFAFRQDPDFESFSNAQVIDVTTGSSNLLLNGDFSLGTPGSNSIPDWIYANIYGATFGGVLEAGCGVGGSNCWYDGAVQAYDAISQTIATTVGDVYQISFNLDGGGFFSPDYYQQLSTNGDVTDAGGNGIDVLAYAQAGLPPPGGAPEPSTWAMMALGFVALGYVGTRKARRSAVAVF